MFIRFHMKEIIETMFYDVNIKTLRKLIAINIKNYKLFVHALRNKI